MVRLPPLLRSAELIEIEMCELSPSDSETREDHYKEQNFPLDAMRLKPPV